MVFVSLVFVMVICVVATVSAQIHSPAPNSEGILEFCILPDVEVVDETEHIQDMVEAIRNDTCMVWKWRMAHPQDLPQVIPDNINFLTPENIGICTLDQDMMVRVYYADSVPVNCMVLAGSEVIVKKEDGRVLSFLDGTPVKPLE